MLEHWSDFYVASAGASAGLAGLIIVAMSVNIDVIVKIPSMPSRAGSTIANLLLIVVISISALMHGLPEFGLGIIVGVGAIVALGFAVDSTVQIMRREAILVGVAKGAVGILPAVLVLVGGVLLIASLDGGLYWVAAGILAAFVGSVLNAWVLLVEIRR